MVDYVRSRRRQEHSVSLQWILDELPPRRQLRIFPNWNRKSVGGGGVSLGVNGVQYGVLGLDISRFSLWRQDIKVYRGVLDLALAFWARYVDMHTSQQGLAALHDMTILLILYSDSRMAAVG